MHSFTIALISTLSLGVHAASIGDPVSQLVTREQHNRLFHNPDFTSANLPAAEPLERAGKISPRKLTVDGSASLGSATLGGFLNGMVSLNTGSNTAQGVPNSQTFTVPSLDSAIGLLSGDNRLNTLDPQTISLGSGIAVNDLLVAIDSNTNTADIQAAAQVVSNAEAAQVAILAQLGRAIANAQVVVNSRVADNVLAAILGQAARGVAALVVVNAQVAQAAVNNCPNLFASNAAVAAVANVEARREDAEKRQLPTLPTLSLPTGIVPANNAGLNTGNAVTTREDNMNFSDDQGEDSDMDFSAHDSEADELEEGF